MEICDKPLLCISELDKCIVSTGSSMDLPFCNYIIGTVRINASNILILLVK